jgi:hypothetical protein
MGTFRIDVEVENPARPGERRRVENVLVDTGAELSWLPSDILEALGIERFPGGGSGRRTVGSSNGGYARRSCTPSASEPRTTSCSAISPCSAPDE